jgi:hypothetical protein
MSSRVRKYDSGCENARKKKRLEVCAQTQKGALDRFVVKDQSTTRNPTTEPNADESIGVEAHTSQIDGAPNNVEPNTSGIDEA